MNTREMVRLDASVAGRVQGVGFRAFTRQQARRLDLTGWVRNEPDGGVRVVAEGPRDVLEHLRDALEKGPSSSRVTNVRAYWSAASGEFDDFSVRYF